LYPTPPAGKLIFDLEMILMNPAKTKKRNKKNTLWNSFLFSYKSIVVLLGFILISLLGWWKLSGEKKPWTALGETHQDFFGDKVAPAGDVNGDGFADVAVWAPNYGEYAGKLYIYGGSPRGLSKSPLWSVQGEAKNDQYGHSFGTAGDVNGDGFGDFIAAAQGYNDPKAVDVGKAYLYLGSSSGLSQTPTWTRTGKVHHELLGDCSGWAGDVNRDGLSDVIIGAYGYDHHRGRAQVFYGSKEKGLAPEPAWSGEGKASDDWYGYSVAQAGDVNGDGYVDVVIGSKQAKDPQRGQIGKVYVYYGSQGGLAPKASWIASGEKADELFGWRAISAGDVNGDGYSDVIASSYMHHEPGPRGGKSGKVYLYEGSPKGLSPQTAWTHIGESAGSFFGMTIASGDFNHDGYSDVVVGSPNFNQGNGKVYLFLGTPRGLSDDSAWSEAGKNTNERFGSYVANAGDVNGDGFPDLLVGAPSNSEAGEKVGKVYLFFGSKTGKLTDRP
jgi:hypothetical protein